MNLSNIKNVPNSREELVLHLQIKQLVTYLIWDHFDKEWNKRHSVSKEEL